MGCRDSLHHSKSLFVPAVPKYGGYPVHLLRIPQIQSGQALPFDEVLPEQKYIQNHTDSNTPDVLVRSGSHYLFFESKSAVPSNGVRVFEQDAIDKHINKLANAVGQLYKQIQNFNNGVYYPFSNQRPTDFSLDNIWGIVSVMEDSFANRKQIYDKVAEHTS